MPRFCKRDCVAGPRSKAPSPQTLPVRWQPQSSAQPESAWPSRSGGAAEHATIERKMGRGAQASSGATSSRPPARPVASKKEFRMTRIPESTRAPEWKMRWIARECARSRFLPAPKPVIGMVHLWPLPGAPGYNGYGMQTIIDHALRDAEALLQGGVDGLMVENMWDLPYYVGNDVKPEAMTAHAVAAAEVVKNSPVPVGINVIHNGGVVCLAIALAAKARFIRVCILTGARLGYRRIRSRLRGRADAQTKRTRRGRHSYFRRRGQKALRPVSRN